MLNRENKSFISTWTAQDYVVAYNKHLNDPCSIDQWFDSILPKQEPKKIMHSFCMLCFSFYELHSPLA